MGQPNADPASARRLIQIDAAGRKPGRSRRQQLADGAMDGQRQEGHGPFLWMGEPDRSRRDPTQLGPGEAPDCLRRLRHQRAQLRARYTHRYAQRRLLELG